MSSIFRSAEFYSPDAVRTQIKSPVQWIVQTSKILETDLPRPQMTINALRQIGQMPFAPPNVKGWDGGKAWITTSTLLFRYNMANFAVGNGPLNMQHEPHLRANKASETDPVFDVPEPQAGRTSPRSSPRQCAHDPKRLVA